MTELEAANTAILNLTAEWHRAEIALDKARRELAAWRAANVVDTRRAVKRALSARRVARYARRMRRERDAARAEVARVNELANFERETAALHIEKLNRDVARLTAALESIADILEADDKPVTATMLRAALRGQPAPAGGESKG